MSSRSSCRSWSTVRSSDRDAGDHGSGRAGGRAIRPTVVVRSGQVRRYLRRRGIGAVISRKPNERHVPNFDRAAYRERNRVEIVCTQMTKAHVLTGGRGGDDIADLDIAVGDDHPVNEQLDELALLLKGG